LVLDEKCLENSTGCFSPRAIVAKIFLLRRTQGVGGGLLTPELLKQKISLKMNYLNKK
jgi:hypothetical protein